MKQLRGINEKTVVVFNPLPDVSEADLLQRVGLADIVEASELNPFRLEWQYSGGLEKEFVVLNPGERLFLRASDAETAMRELREQGAVIHDIDASDAVIRRLSIDGVMAAIRFWNERGRPRLIEQRQKHGYTNEDMESRRYEYRHYHLADARRAVLEEHLRELRAPKPKAEAPASKGRG